MIQYVAGLLVLLIMVWGGAVDPGSAAPGGKVLVVALSFDPITLNGSQTTNVAVQSVYGLIQEQLVYFSPDGDSIRPGLASDWKWVTPTVLEMRLRPGVRFTNGEPMNAEAAKFSIEQYLNPFYEYFLHPGIYRDTEIVNETTFRVHLTAPFAPFLSFLARSVGMMPPKHYREVGKDAYGQYPIGTGPFILSQWRKADRIVLTRNPSYWQGSHAMSQIVFRIIPDELARVAALEADEVDIAYLLPYTAVKRLDRNPRVRTVQRSGLRKFAVHFDTMTPQAVPALKDPRVRRALNHAVDKAALVARVYAGQAEPLPGQFLLRQEFGFNPSVREFKYDPATAKKLLAEAGQSTFTLPLVSTVGRYPGDKEQAEIVAHYIEQVGVRVSLRPLEYGAFLRHARDRSLGTYLWGLLFPPDPHFNMSIFQPGAVYQYHHFGAEWGRLFAEGYSTTDRARSLEVYRRMGQIMHEDPSMLYLVAPRDIYGVSPRVKGFVPRADQFLWLFDVDVE